MRKPVCKRLDSFTLVEVVIALAIAAFVLVSLLGLMAYASQTVAQSDKYARLAGISAQVLATLEARQFAALRTAPSTTNTLGSGDLFTGTLSTAITFNFNAEGIPTTNNGADVYYQVKVTNENSTPPALKDPSGYLLFEELQIMILWPKVQGSTAPFANTNIFVSSVANFALPVTSAP